MSPERLNEETARALTNLMGGNMLRYTVESVEGTASAELIRDIALVQHADAQRIVAALNDLNENIITATGEITAALERSR